MKNKNKNTSYEKEKNLLKQNKIIRNVFIKFTIVVLFCVLFFLFFLIYTITQSL